MYPGVWPGDDNRDLLVYVAKLMRLFNETLQAPGTGSWRRLGNSSKLIVLPVSFTGGSFSMGLELYAPGVSSDAWIEISVQRSHSVGEWVNIGRYTNNLPFHAAVRVHLLGEDIEELIYHIITDA